MVQCTSLNDQLLEGPDLTNMLVGVLIRFQQEHCHCSERNIGSLERNQVYATWSETRVSIASNVKLW